MMFTKHAIGILLNAPAPNPHTCALSQNHHDDIVWLEGSMQLSCQFPFTRSKRGHRNLQDCSVVITTPPLLPATTRPVIVLRITCLIGGIIIITVVLSVISPVARTTAAQLHLACSRAGSSANKGFNTDRGQAFASCCRLRYRLRNLLSGCS